jgi:hypothetical protein
VAACSANAGLPETANRGHLNEATIGLRLAGALPAAFDYEIEMDRQTGSLGVKLDTLQYYISGKGRTTSSPPALVPGRWMFKRAT